MKMPKFQTTTKKSTKCFDINNKEIYVGDTVSFIENGMMARIGIVIDVHGKFFISLKTKYGVRKTFSLSENIKNVEVIKR